MNQLELRLLGRIDAPSVVPSSEIAKVATYREAVRLCWAHRRSRNMTNSTLAELTGMRPSHIAEYFHPLGKDSKGHDMRDMPAKYLPAFEAVAGNTFATQWLAAQSKLTILESLIPDRHAA